MSLDAGGRDSKSRVVVEMPARTETVEEWVIIAGCATQILKCGTPQKGQPLMIIIPGNPGIADYYEEFMWTLYDLCDHNVPIWCVTHAGHVSTPSDMPQTTPVEDVYSVGGQTKHKLMFLHTYVPTESPLILIGHSIGAYIILKLLKIVPESQVVQGVLLFPTIERMRQSPKGLVVTPFLRYFRWMVPITMYPFYYMTPSSMQNYLAKMYFRNKDVPLSAINATLQLVAPSCVANVFYMGKTEMEHVVEADHEMIRKNLDKLLFYYGQDDPWCPVEYYQDMKKRYPNGDIHLCDQNFDHAFVLESSSDMARVLHKLLQNKLPQIFGS